MSRILKWLQPLCLVAVPAALAACALTGQENSALLTTLVAMAALIPFFLRFERRRARPRDILPIVVLAAVAALGRTLMGALPNIHPVSAIVIVGAVCFGRESGFLTGAVAALASNLFLGQGAWTPWQMYAWGMMGYLSGLLAPWLKERRLGAAVYGAVVSVAFGMIMDTWFLLGFVRPLTPASVIAAYAAGAGMNLLHAASTAVFVLAFFPWVRKLERIKIKYGILE